MRGLGPEDGDQFNTLVSRLDAEACEAAREDKERDELEIPHRSGRETADLRLGFGFGLAGASPTCG